MPPTSSERRSGFPTGARLRPAGQPSRARSALVLAVLLVSACGPARVQRGVVSEHLGHGSRYQLDEAVNRILHQAGYSVRHRSETSARIHYETAWMTRKPFHDEAARGADELRTRIIVEAHRQRLNVYSVKLRAESTARSKLDGRWGPAPTSARFREHVEAISSAITLQIDAGVRVY